VPVVGEEVSKTNAAAWQTAGYTGAGLKIGIVDGFGETPWNTAEAAAEVPAPAGTFCQAYGAPCSAYTCGVSPCTIFTITPTEPHGTAVAEVIHEMAPDAQIYLATVITTTDLQAAVDYFAAQGVTIISRSATSEYDGPGDGTGPIANVINSAVSQGMAWFNSAGNEASDGVSPPNGAYGGYWRGPWVDANANGRLEWAPGVEYLAFACGLMHGLRWSDWGVNPTDYDLRIYSSLNPLILAYSSVNDQTTGAPPLEMNQSACNGNVYYAAVQLDSAGGGTAGDVLEFGVNGCCLQYWQNAYSASGSAADSASPGEVTVGAIDPPLGTTIASYSSQGPTNDDRIKPDLSAAACVASLSYAPGCFAGTSASTPATAGAAALVLGAGLASTPAQLRTYLLDNATVDRGAAGSDNVYGRGELILPAPPTLDTDGDGCTDIVEAGSNHAAGGQRDPLNYWDFYDVGTNRGVGGAGDEDFTKDRKIDFQDALIILDHFGHDGSDVNDHDMDRMIPDASAPWKAAEATPGDTVTLLDVLYVLKSFGDHC
jgi:hypothetical protein